MPEPVKCDQCGCAITDEEFGDGGAFRDRADVLCAKCYKMYQQEDERRREREEKLAKVETSADRARAAGHGPGRGAERRALAGHRRGITRKITPGRKGAGRRAPDAKKGLVGVFIAAAVVAFIIAASAIYLLKKGAKAPPEGAGPARVGTETVPPPPPPSPPPPAAQPKPAPEGSGAVRKKPGAEKSEFGKSLFGPDGDFTRRKKQ